jgi:hypothetical protein
MLAVDVEGAGAFCASLGAFFGVPTGNGLLAFDLHLLEVSFVFDAIWILFSPVEIGPVAVVVRRISAEFMAVVSHAVCRNNAQASLLCFFLSREGRCMMLVEFPGVCCEAGKVYAELHRSHGLHSRLEEACSTRGFSFSGIEYSICLHP